MRKTNRVGAKETQPRSASFLLKSRSKIAKTVCFNIQFSKSTNEGRQEIEPYLARQKVIQVVIGEEAPMSALLLASISCATIGGTAAPLASISSTNQRGLTFPILKSNQQALGDHRRV